MFARHPPTMSGDKTAAPALEATEAAATAKVDAPTAAVESAKDAAAPAGAKVPVDSESAAADASAPTESATATVSDKATEASTDKSSEQPTTDQKPDVEMADAATRNGGPAGADENPALAQDEKTVDAAAAVATPSKSKAAAKRKSIGGTDTKGKKLNKKASKARLLHTDAEPGDHFFVKLKGFPQWPVIICDEDMLPQSLLKSRPVTAKRADGTYRDDYADGAKKVADRTFPVMYLHTNEFGWVPNFELIDLDPESVKDIKTDKMRKDLQAAHELAAENHPITYYKEVLQQFQEDLLEQEKAKAAKAATPKGKKSKAAAVDEDEDEDVEMADAPEEDSPPVKEKKVTKKRKAEDSVETPQKSDSVKKPKIKLTVNSTPKTTNGTPQSAKPKATTESKPATKVKVKKAEKTERAEKAEKVEKVEKEAVTPKEPELSPEEKHARKEKEVLFLRHKLQKGLLTRDQEPKEEEMKLMSEYIAKLEGFPDLEVSIIRATKINKVLKAILKLDNIPKEEEFQFKPRSQSLLDKWNERLAVDGAAAPAPAKGANGVNGTSATKTNGIKEKTEAADKPKDEPAPEASESKEEAKPEEEVTDSAEKPAEEAKAPEAVAA